MSDNDKNVYNTAQRSHSKCVVNIRSERVMEIRRETVLTTAVIY